MKYGPAYVLMLAFAVLASCSENRGTQRPVVPAVSEILSDKDCAAYRLLSVDSKPDRNGAIFIVGEKEDCDILSSELSSCDYLDNVDGKAGRDGLQDFCGERVCSIYDHAGGDYQSYIEKGIGDSLRTRMVSLCLLALDTLCYVSPYDLDGLVSQPRAKLIVLASSLASRFGLYDVDSLFNGSSCAVPVLNPLALMKKDAFDDAAGAVGVMSSSSFAISAGLYEGCAAFRSDTTGKDRLISFLDSYRAVGMQEPLKALIVDDYSVDIRELELTLSRIRSVMNEEFLVYSPLLTEDFRIIDSRRTISSECARYLRSHNMYTHLILRPRCERYMTVSRPELVLIPYNERYVTEGRYGI